MARKIIEIVLLQEINFNPLDNRPNSKYISKQKRPLFGRLLF